MKNFKIILSSFTFLAVIFFMAGCVKTPDPIPDPVPTPINPVITVTGIPSDSIPFGDSVVLSWSIKNYVTATLNGSDIPATGTKSTGRILKDSTFQIRATGPNGGKTEKSFTIKVKDWKSSNFGMISHDYWVVYSQAYKLDTMPNFIVTNLGSSLDPRVRDYEIFYYPDGTYTVKSKSGAFPPKNGAQWDIDGDSLELFNNNLVGKALIDSISTHELSLIHKSVYFLANDSTIPCLYKTVYRHDD